METIRKVRLAYHRDHKSIREIASAYNLSRNTVRKIIRSNATEFVYERKVQPRPRLEPFKEQLAGYLKEDSAKPAKQRRSAILLFDQLQRDGFDGGYDSARRYIKICSGQGGAVSAQPQPDAVLRGVCAGDPGDGSGCPCAGIQLLRRCLPQRDL